MVNVGPWRKCSTHSDCGVPARMWYPGRLWGPGVNAVYTHGDRGVPGCGQHPWRSLVSVQTMAIMAACYGGSFPHTDPTVPAFMPTFTTIPGGTGAMLPASLVQQSSEGTGGELQPVSNSTVPGLALIPVQNILKGEFVDMYELLPETWRAEEPRNSCCRSSRLGDRHLTVDGVLRIAGGGAHNKAP